MSRRQPRTFAPWAYWLFIGAGIALMIGVLMVISSRMLG